MATREYTVQRIAPMSAFRTAFSLSIIGLAAWIICAVVLYLGMAAFGVWDQVNQVIGGVGGDQTLSFGVVMSLVALIGAIFAIFFSALAPLTAVLYNAVVDLFVVKLFYSATKQSRIALRRCNAGETRPRAGDLPSPGHTG